MQCDKINIITLKNPCKLVIIKINNMFAESDNSIHLKVYNYLLINRSYAKSDKSTFKSL